MTKACLERIHQVEPKVHAFVTITEELALKQAQKADELLAAGGTNPLTGIPVLIKDNMCTRGIPTTCSSKILENFEVLQQVDTSDILPTAQSIALQNVVSADEVASSLSQSQVLANAPQKEGDFFKVRAVLE